MDLSNLSDKDLKAIASGDMSSISDAGLNLIAGFQPAQQPEESNWYDPERLAANPAIRFATAAARPVIAAMEMIPGEIGESWKRRTDQLRQLEQEGLAKQSEAAQIAGGGADIAGSILSPASLGLMKALPMATGAVGAIPKTLQYAKNIGIGAGIGSVSGLLTPTGTTGDKLEQIETGAKYGAGFSAAAPAIIGSTQAAIKGAGYLTDVATGQIGKVNAGKIMRDVAGAKLPEIKQALMDAPENFTASQAALKVDRDVWQALGALAQHKDKDSFYRILNDTEELKALDKLAKLARGDSSETSAAARKLMKSRIEQHLGKVREAELSKAGIAGSEGAEQGAIISENIGGRLIDPISGKPAIRWDTGEPVYTGRAGDIREAGKLFAASGEQVGFADKTAARKLGVIGDVKIVRNIERANENYDASKAFVNIAAERSKKIAEAESTLAGIERAGLEPLDISPILNRIDMKLSSKMTRTNPDEVLVLNTLKDRLSIAAEGGVTDPFALYNIRKTSVNQVIDQLSSSGKLSKEQASKVLNDIKPMIDKAIEDAGGTKWGSGYMNKYAKAFEAIERVEVLDAMRKMYKDNPQSFVDVVRGEKPEIIQKVMEGKIGFDDAFSNNTKATLRDIANRTEMVTEEARRAKDGVGGLGDILDKDTIRAKMPAFINRWFTIGNKTLDVLEQKINRSAMEKIVEGMKSGQNALDVINTLPSTEKNVVLKVMNNMDANELRKFGVIGAATMGNQQ